MSKLLKRKHNKQNLNQNIDDIKYLYNSKKDFNDFRNFQDILQLLLDNHGLISIFYL